MKKLIFTIGLLSTYLLSYGQEEKSDFLKRGSSVLGTYLWGGYSSNLGIIGSTGLRYGYFLKDNLTLGFDSRFTTNGDRYREVNFGPFLRYYLPSPRIKPFLEARYGFGLSESNIIEGRTSQSDRIRNAYLGSGLLLTNKERRIGIEFSTGYEFDFSNSSNSRFTGGIGLNIKL